MVLLTGSVLLAESVLVSEAELSLVRELPCLRVSFMMALCLLCCSLALFGLLAMDVCTIASHSLTFSAGCSTLLNLQPSYSIQFKVLDKQHSGLSWLPLHAALDY